ncbi:MAG: methyl-accepting chemotaxis protein [Halobaculum sp.]
MELDPRESYRSKVLIGVAVVILVGAGIGAATVSGVSEVVRGERTATVEAEANVQDNTIQTVVFSLETSAARLADTTARVRAASVMSSEAQRKLNKLYSERTESEQLSAVHLVDPKTDTVLATSNPQVAGKSSSLLGYEIPSNMDQSDTILRAKTAGTASWVVYTKTPAGDVLVMETPLSYVDDRIASVLDESRTRIVNVDGVVVYDGQNASAIGTQHTAGDGISSPAVRSGILGNKGVQRVAGDVSPTGEELVVGYDGIDSTTWAVVTYTEPNALFAVVDNLRRSLFVLLGAIAVLLFGFVLTVERPALRDLDSLQTSVEKLRSGDLDTAVETDRRDEIGDLARGLDEMRLDLQEQISEAERATAEAEEARAEAEELSQHLESKAETYRESIQRLADGDFTVRVDPESRHDGMAEIGETLNEVVADLEATIGDVQSFADEVAASMQQLSASANEIESATSEVARTVQEISTGTDEQRDQLQQVAEEMNNLSATVEEVASTSGSVADSAEKAARRGEEGRSAAEDASEALDEIEAVTDEAVAEVDALVEQVAQIEEFAEVIGDIAEQTNMLALNANIEAARTDTDGDGFAVVADEIKQLAVEAGERADDIDSLIGEVEAQTTDTADRMRTASDRLSESNDTVEDAIDALVEIDEIVEETNRGMQDINRATDDQASSTEEVAAMVDEVSEIAEENATDASEVSAAAEEQTATVSEVSRTAEQVAEQAAELSSAVTQFTVDPDGDADSSGADGTDEDDGVDGVTRETAADGGGE